jgi:hypothetical protein
MEWPGKKYVMVEVYVLYEISGYKACYYMFHVKRILGLPIAGTLSKELFFKAKANE